jgi:hypothetical protein
MESFSTWGFGVHFGVKPGDLGKDAVKRIGTWATTILINRVCHQRQWNQPLPRRRVVKGRVRHYSCTWR